MRLEQIVERVEHDAIAHFLDLVDGADELLPELGEHGTPVDLARGNFVELFLEAGGEIVFDVAREEAFQERNDDAAFVFGNEALLVDADIAAVLQHLQDGGVGRGPADAELFHALDQSRFRKARRRLGEMLRGLDRLLAERFALRHRGQAAQFVIVGRFVLAFLIESEKAIELHHLAGCAQFDVARTRLGDDVDRGALEFGGFHLARDRAIPDQFVEPRLVAIDIFGDFGGCAAGARRAHRFVRFLRVLRLVVIFARRSRDVFLAVVVAEHGANVGNCLRRHVDAVGTHIGDQAGGFAVDLHAFVEPLRESHGDRRGEAELAACFLLHGRGGEGRRRIATGRFRLDRGHLEDSVLKIAGERFRLGAGTNVEALDLLPVGADQARFEDLVARCRQLGDDRPVFLGDEFLDLELAVADKTKCDRLHATGRARARQLAPEHRRERKADEVIEGAAGEIGIDQCAVDLARMLHRLGHRLLGDGVEHHALDLLVLERLLLLQHLEHVPRDRFAFAIRVGGEDQLVGTLEGAAMSLIRWLRLGDRPPRACGNRCPDRPSRPWGAGRGYGQKRPGPRSRSRGIY